MKRYNTAAVQHQFLQGQTDLNKVRSNDFKGETEHCNLPSSGPCSSLFLIIHVIVSHINEWDHGICLFHC